MHKRVLYVGIDLGDKTTSIFYTNSGNDDNTNCIQLPGTLGNSPLESVVCLLKSGKTILKDAISSYEISEIDTVYHNFKRKPGFLTKNQYHNMKEGIRLFLNHIFNSCEFQSIMGPLLQGKDKVVFCIGFPTNWSDTNIERYRQMIETSIIGLIDKDGFMGVPTEVVYERESTGAYVYINNLNKVTKQYHLKQSGNILVLDFGSSTVNVTALGRDSRHPLYSSGNNRFGGRQLDCLIASYCIQHLTKQQKDLFDDIDRHNNQIATRLMVLEASLTKEALSVKEKSICNLDIIDGARIRLSREDLHNIAFNIPMNTAVNIIPGIIKYNDSKSWVQELTDYLAEEKNTLQKNGILPELVILTGGGASMPLIQDICKLVFGTIQLIDASEASSVIARGLAVAAKNQEKSQVFDKEVAEYLKENLPKRIEGEFSSLVNALASDVAQYMGTRLKDELHNWKIGRTSTFDGVITQMRKIDSHILMQDSIQKWYETKVRTECEKELGVICKKYGAVEFTLPKRVQMKFDSIMLPYTRIFEAVCDVIVKTIGIIIVFLAGALALTGFGLVILAAAAGVAVPYLLFNGWESTKGVIVDNLRSVDLPDTARLLISDEKINQIVNDNIPEIKKSVERSVYSGKDSIKKSIESEISKQVNAKINEIRYELMI